MSFQNRITAHLPGIPASIHHTVRTCIVDIIIGEMYFEPHEEDDNNLEDTSRRKHYQFFKEVEDITGMYHIVIRNPIQFGLIVDYLS